MKRFLTSLTAFTLLLMGAAVASPVFADEPNTKTAEISVDALTTQDVIDLVDALFVSDAADGEVGKSLLVTTTRDDYDAAVAAVTALADTVTERADLLLKLEVAEEQLFAKDFILGLYDETGTGLNLDTVGNVSLFYTAFDLISVLPNGAFKDELYDLQSVAIHYQELYTTAQLLIDDAGNAIYQLTNSNGDIFEIDEVEFNLIAHEISLLPDGPFKTLLTEKVTTASAERDAYTYAVTSEFVTFTGKGEISVSVNAPTNGLRAVYVIDAEGNSIALTFTVTFGKTTLTISEEELVKLSDGNYLVYLDYVGDHVVTTEFTVDKAKTPDPKPDPETDEPTGPTDPVNPGDNNNNNNNGNNDNTNDKPKSTLPATGMNSNNAALSVSAVLIATGVVFIALRKRENA